MGQGFGKEVLSGASWKADRHLSPAHGFSIKSLSLSEPRDSLCPAYCFGACVKGCSHSKCSMPLCLTQGEMGHTSPGLL